MVIKLPNHRRWSGQEIIRMAQYFPALNRQGANPGGDGTTKGELNHARIRWRAGLAIMVLTVLGILQCRAQTPALIDPTSGLRLLVVEENTLPVSSLVHMAGRT